MQLRGVQTKFSSWQGMLRGGTQKQALQRELEDDCQSLEYMVGGVMGVGPVEQCRCQHTCSRLPIDAAIPL